MRVLILHSTYLSGPASGENQVVEDEARLLRDGGHDVDLLCPTPSGLTGLRAARAGLEAVWSRRARAELEGAVARFQPHVVHCHNLFPLLSPAVLSHRALGGVAVVMTLHNYRLMCLPANLLRDGRACEDCLGRVPWRGVAYRCYRESLTASAALATSLSAHRAMGTFAHVSLFLAVSDHVRRKHVESGAVTGPIVVKPNFTWPSPRRRGPGDYFLYVGRLSPEKGVDTLLEAWADAPGRLVVVGAGPDEQRLRREASPSVEFRGQVPRSEIPRILGGARALLVPSICEEAFGRAATEAYAAGVPAVASRIGGLNEIVEHERSGLLVEPRRAQDWADAAERLLDDGESERLGQGGWELWHERYRPEVGLARLEEAYRKARAFAGAGAGMA